MKCQSLSKLRFFVLRLCCSFFISSMFNHCAEHNVKWRIFYLHKSTPFLSPSFRNLLFRNETFDWSSSSFILFASSTYRNWKTNPWKFCTYRMCYIYKSNAFDEFVIRFDKIFVLCFFFCWLWMKRCIFVSFYAYSLVLFRLVFIDVVEF